MFEEIYDEDYLNFYDAVQCIGDLGEKWCNFKWRIYNIQLYPHETFQSPAFTTRLLPKMYWCLEVTLSSPGDLKTLKIGLRRLRTPENIQSIIDVIYKVNFNDETKISSKSKVIFDNKMPLNGNSDYSIIFGKPLKDYVTLECKLRPNKEMIEKVLHHNLDPTLPVDLRNLLKSSELYDTVIKVGYRQLKAHYFILYVRLPNLLTVRKMEKDKHVIIIDDLPISVVKEMLKYAYTGQGCVDLEAEGVNKDVIIKYDQNFYQRCYWEDNPVATTFFIYETESLSWDLERLLVAKCLGSKDMRLLRIYPSKIEILLAVRESEGETWFSLTFFCGKEMPKSAVVSCKYFLEHVKTNKTYELGEAETLLSSSRTEIKLCRRIDVEIIKSTFCSSDIGLNLKLDFKFCYGNSKCSIDYVYEGQFDTSQCTSCAKLSSDMAYLTGGAYSDIYLMSGNHTIRAHKAILIARFRQAETLQVKENNCISIKGYNYDGLMKLISLLYTGNETLKK